jgi:uncharacterized Zn-finger protein
MQTSFQCSTQETANNFGDEDCIHHKLRPHKKNVIHPLASVLLGEINVE